MCKNSCLECKHYKYAQTVSDGWREVMKGVFMPKEKKIPHNCEEHPTYFKKWWKENSNKHREDVDYIEPKCFEPTDLRKALMELKDINDILNRLKAV